jgi:hypothetical protein
LINGIAVMEKQEFASAVNVSNFGEKKSPSVGDGASGGVVEVAVPEGPLGACR